MPPISRSGYANGLPLLERFISSSWFSHPGHILMTSDLPGATLLASFSADVRLGLPYRAGLVVRPFCPDMIFKFIWRAIYLKTGRPRWPTGVRDAGPRPEACEL